LAQQLTVRNRVDFPIAASSVAASLWVSSVAASLWVSSVAASLCEA
jgi:hypothetical protein